MNSNKKRNLESTQITLFDLPIIERKEDNSVIESIQIQPNCNNSDTKFPVTIEQQKVINKFKKENSITRIILYSGGSIGIETELNTNEYLTYSINNQGKEDFKFNKKSPVLPWDKILYYNLKFECIKLTEIQSAALDKFLNSNRKDIKKIIKRKGDENILIEMIDKVVSITPIGWVLSFKNIIHVDYDNSELLEL